MRFWASNYPLLQTSYIRLWARGQARKIESYLRHSLLVVANRSVEYDKVQRVEGWASVDRGRWSSGSIDVA